MISPGAARRGRPPGRPRSWWLGPVVAWLGFAACGVGCAGGQRGAELSPTPPSFDHLSPRERLAALADWESRIEGPSIIAEPPPGVDPSHLAPRAADDPRAFLAVAEAVAAFQRDQPLPAAETAAPPQGVGGEADDFGRRMQAQVHYVRGMQAAVEGRHFVAVQDFEQALAFDPSSAAALRQAARSYAATRNAARANAMYERLYRLTPDDREAALTVGLNMANQRRFDEVIPAMGPVRSRTPSGAPGSFETDPAADVLADQALALAFEHYGFDAAAAECLQRAAIGIDTFSGQSPYASTIAALARARADRYRLLGDLHCRLGRFGEARAAYQLAAADGTVPPVVLAPRRMFVALREGKPHVAQKVLWDLLESEAWRPEERSIQWAGWLRNSVHSVAVLSECAREALGESPTDAASARLRAALLPPARSIALLRSVVEQNPDDTSTLDDLLQWLAREGPARAAVFVAELVRADPARGDQYTARLFAAVGLPGDSVAWPAEPGAGTRPPAPFVRARLFLLAGAPAEAWRLSEAGLRDDPSSPLLRLVQIQAAAAMREPELLEQSIREADAAFPPAPVRSGALAVGAEAASSSTGQAPSLALHARLVIVAALRDIGRTTDATAAAISATSQWPDSAAAWTERARCEAVAPGQSTAAESSARIALTLDPRHEPAHELLLTLYASSGPLADQAKLQQQWDELTRVAPSGRLAAIITSDRLIGARRASQAIDTLMPWHERDPADAEVLGRIVSAFLEDQQAASARTWLQDRLARRADDPLLLRQWVRVLLSLRDFEEIEARLNARRQAWPLDPVAPALLEVVWRAQGRLAEAEDLARARLARRPEGVQRSIELASLEVSAGRWRQALAGLTAIRQRFDTLPREATAGLLAIAAQLPNQGRETEEARLGMVEQFLARWPDAPLSVYAPGFLALARLDESGETFESMVRRGIRNTPAGGSDAAAAAAWRDVAQMLLDDGRPTAAARAALIRLQADPALERPAAALLSQVAQACFIRAGRVEEARSVIDDLAARAMLDILPLPREIGHLHAEAYYWLSVLATQIGESVAAEDLLRRSLAMAPDNATALNNLGYHRIDSNHDDAESVGMVERAFDRSPNDANILDSIGWLRYKQGRFERDDDGDGARGLLERSISATRSLRREPSAEAYDHLGDVLWRLGDRARAVEAWDIAVRIVNDAERRATTIQGLRGYQRNVWGVELVSSESLYDLHDGAVGRRAADKAQAARAGNEPAVAPTFKEARAGR